MQQRTNLLRGFTHRLSTLLWIALVMTLAAVAFPATADSQADSEGDEGGGGLSIVHLEDVFIATNSNPRLYLQDIGTATWALGANGNGVYILDESGEDAFWIRKGADEYTLVAGPNNHVGIGTFVPAANLHVVEAGASSVRFENTTAPFCGPANSTACTWDYGVTKNGTFKVSEINSGVVEFRFSDEGMFFMKPVSIPPTLNAAEGAMYVDNSGALCVNLNGVWVAAATQGSGSCG